jgi:hypothetical protein
VYTLGVDTLSETSPSRTPSKFSGSNVLVDDGGALPDGRASVVYSFLFTRGVDTLSETSPSRTPSKFSVSNVLVDDAAVHSLTVVPLLSIHFYSRLASTR